MVPYGPYHTVPCCAASYRALVWCAVTYFAVLCRATRHRRAVPYCTLLSWTVPHTTNRFSRNQSLLGCSANGSPSVFLHSLMSRGTHASTSPPALAWTRARHRLPIYRSPLHGVSIARCRDTSLRWYRRRGLTEVCVVGNQRCVVCGLPLHTFVTAPGFDAIHDAGIHQLSQLRWYVVRKH